MPLITRPAIANERLTLNRAGQVVVLTLKTPYRDGTTHIVMSPLEFMQRLAALVPRPRLLAAGWLSRVVALRDVLFSNSMIEAFWRTLKHQMALSQHTGLGGSRPTPGRFLRPCPQYRSPTRRLPW